MTNVEKEMNKNDLFAYKVFDNNQYALIGDLLDASPRLLSLLQSIETLCDEWMDNFMCVDGYLGSTVF